MWRSGALEHDIYTRLTNIFANTLVSRGLVVKEISRQLPYRSKQLTLSSGSSEVDFSA